MKDSVINEIEILTNFPMKNENTRSRAERRKLNAKKAKRKFIVPVLCALVCPKPIPKK